MYFNKKLLGSYNSTEGKYTGYTQKTIEIATALNKNTAFLEQEKKNLENCKQNIPKILKALEGAGNVDLFNRKPGNMQKNLQIFICVVCVGVL